MSRARSFPAAIAPQGLARMFAPVLLLDRNEPFEPTHVLVEIGDAGHGTCEIEYVFAWEADIGHVREVERVWVALTTVGDEARVLGVDASSHGTRKPLQFRSANKRPMVWCEPGKHAGAGGPSGFDIPRDMTDWWCDAGAGMDGLDPSGVRAHRMWRAPAEQRRAMHALTARRFVPAWEFSRRIDSATLPWVDAVEFDRCLEAHCRALIATASSRPLEVPCGGWEGADPFVGIILGRWQDRQWILGNAKLQDVLERARRDAKRVLLEIPTVPEAAISDLHRVAWDLFMSSMIFVIAEPAMAAALAAHGFHYAERLVAAQPPSLGHGWVATATEHDTRVWSPVALVIGPGPADIVVA